LRINTHLHTKTQIDQKSDEIIMSSFETCPDLELFYFDFPGKAEAARLICHCAGLPLKDTRLGRDEFIAAKTSGKFAFGQVPCLFVTNGSKTSQICQSSTIARYLGKLSGHYPTDRELAAKVDMIVDEEADMFTALTCATYTERMGFGSLDEASVETIRNTIGKDIIPKHLGFLEKILESSKTGWFASTPEPTIADFILAPRLKWLQSGLDQIPTTIVDGFPCVTAFLNKFYAHAKIAEYYANK